MSYWRKYVHEVLVNHLGGLSLPRKSVVRLTDSPDVTLDVYRGCKTTTTTMKILGLRCIVQWAPGIKTSWIEYCVAVLKFSLTAQK